jgi:hypothetical protein
MGVWVSIVVMGIFTLLPTSEIKSRRKASLHEKPILAKAVLASPKNRIDTLKAIIAPRIRVKMNWNGL